MAGLNTSQIMDMAKSMGSGISDSQAQSILSSAWDQNQYGADAGKVKAALASLGGGSSGGSSGGGNSQVFDTAKSALQQRYDSLIAGLKGQQATETERQTVTTSNELGKRGILPSSGVAGQEMTNALNPITRGYSGLMSNAASELGTNLSNLALQQYNSQQTAAQNAAQNAIAQGQLANQTKQTEYNVNAPYFKPDNTGSGVDFSGLDAWVKNQGGLQSNQNQVNGWSLVGPSSTQQTQTQGNSGIYNALQTVDPIVKLAQKYVTNPIGNVISGATNTYSNWMKLLASAGPSAKK